MSREREDVTFTSGGSTVAAWLYRPRIPPPHPLVLLAHGLGAERVHRLDAYAERFAAAGLAALVFDYRHFGDSEGEPRQLVHVRRQLDDWQSALEYARAHQEVDRERMALWGTSLSGGHVQTIASRGRGVRAVVAQAPFVDGRVVAASVGWRQALRIAGAVNRDVLRAMFGLSPHRIRIFGQPGTLAAMTAPGAEETIRRTMIPPGEWDETMPARTFATLPFYRPGRKARRIECPILYVIADFDSTTPPEAALAAASRAPQAEVVRLPIDHFDIYAGDAFEQVVAAEVEFLKRHLLSDVPSAAAGGDEVRG